MLHVVHAEQLLEAHAADTGHSIQTGQGQCGNAHGHKHRGKVLVQAKAHEEAGNAAAEDLERSAVCGGAVCSSRSTGHAQSDDSQQAFQHHGTIADLQHILLIGNGLGGGAGRHQTVETGNSAAGNGNEQDGEHGAQLGVGKAGEHRQVHDGMVDDQAQNSAHDHGHEHKGGHVVTGLLQQPHGQDSGKEDVHKGDVAPCSLAQNDGEVCTHHKGQHDEYDADHILFPAGEVQVLLQQAKDHGEHHEHDRDHAGSTVGLGSLHQSTVSTVGIEGAGHHVGKGGNHDAAEQPAEQQEQLAAGLADVLLDQQAHGFAVVLDGSVQSAEVSDSAEEDAADQHPQQDRQPAEGSGLNGTGNRAGTGNGGKLVCKHRPAVGGNIILAILQPHSRSFGVGVNTPGLGEPTTVSGVRTYQNDRGNQNDYKRIHLNESLFPNRFYNRLCILLYCDVLCLSTHCSQNSNMLIFGAKCRKFVVCFVCFAALTKGEEGDSIGVETDETFPYS